MSTITIDTIIHSGIENVWRCWTTPTHIMKWNNASPAWHTPRAENDLRVGGTFLYRMEAKDGTEGFDFTGTYTNVVEHDTIEYTMEDSRHVTTTFVTTPNGVHVTVTFDAETEHPEEMQRKGWQAILDNVKTYIES